MCLALNFPSHINSSFRIISMRLGWRKKRYEESIIRFSLSWLRAHIATDRPFAYYNFVLVNLIKEYQELDKKSTLSRQKKSAEEKPIKILSSSLTVRSIQVGVLLFVFEDYVFEIEMAQFHHFDPSCPNVGGMAMYIIFPHIC